MTHFKSALAIAAALLATSAMADVTFYQDDNFAGPSITATTNIRNFERFGFNDRASSVVVRGDRNDRWEVCEDARFEGRCVVLRPGQYASIRSMGLNDRISSVRMVGNDERIADNRYAPVYAVAAAAPVYTTDYRRRPDERLYEARVTTVRAVVGTPQQRCWIEREQVGTTSNGSGPNVGGAVAGALIGGILGHQIGGGSGRDAATALGVVGGAALGSNAGNGGGQVVTQDVQRCTTAVNQQPEYYDVGYVFEGRDYRVQLQSPPPGSTILVNGAGEPRS